LCRGKRWPGKEETRPGHREFRHSPGRYGVQAGSQWTCPDRVSISVSEIRIDYNDNVPNLMPLVDIGMGFADLV